MVSMPPPSAKLGKVESLNSNLNVGEKKRKFWGNKEEIGGEEICGKKKICGKREDRYLAGLPEVCGELESVVQSTVNSRKTKLRNSDLWSKYLWQYFHFLLDFVL